ncbi:MAG: hypothetical protein VX546_11600 [Myxococcota bacterium]|nr:hypothetical protein [Myxococcota bacterium]
MIRAFLLVLALVLALGNIASASGLSSARQVLERLGFAPTELEEVLDGQFAQRAGKSDADSDIAVALAFLVRTPPVKFDRELTGKRFVFSLDPHTLGGDEIPGNGSLGDFAGLTLSAAERNFYATTGAGGSVNLSAPELAQLAALDGPGPEVDVVMRKILFARFQRYKADGLDGLAPYDRGDGKKTDPASSLRADSESAGALTGGDPRLARFLLDYPESAPAGLVEKFYWLRYEAHGEPVLVLTHAFSAPVGDWTAFCQRQFYVSRGYNTEQALALFMPVKEGTLVAYLNHTSTDQVLGFGGSAKRAIGERLMMRQLSGLFEKLRKAAAESQ